MENGDHEDQDIEQPEDGHHHNEAMSGEWEDIETIVDLHSSGVSTSSRTSGSPRKRRAGSARPIYIAAPSTSRKSYQPSARPRASRQSSSFNNSLASPSELLIPRNHVEIPPLFNEGDVQFAVHIGIRSTLRYILDIVVTILYWVQKPLSWAIALLLVLYLMSFLGRPLRFCLRPVCTLPFVSRSEFCTSIFPPQLHAVDPSSLAPGEKNKIHRADYPQIMNLETQTFEKLLDDTIGGSALALEIRKAELATSDLITLVKFSDLTTKQGLADALEAFVNEAKSTARNLQKLDTKVIGALDSVSQMNEYALKLIESADATQSPNSLSPIRILHFLGISPTRLKPSQDAAVLETFDQTMTMLAGTLQRLILQAEVAQQSLEILEERLRTLHEMVAREDHSLTEARQDVLDLVWTKLGFNRRELRKFEAHFALLRHVGAYRTRALAHVVAALHALREMSDGMEDLRDRVAAPELVGAEIPLEVHVQSIKAGLNRLKQGGLKASQKRIAIQDALIEGKWNDQTTINS